jgi:uncharacterized coiled-coil protein SlyX
MENLIKEIEAIEHDVQLLINRAGDYRNDADRGLKFEELCDNKDKTIEYLSGYLTDAVYDIDRMRFDMIVIMEHLTNLLDSVEYESIAQKAIKE